MIINVIYLSRENVQFNSINESIFYFLDTYVTEMLSGNFNQAYKYSQLDYKILYLRFYFNAFLHLNKGNHINEVFLQLRLYAEISQHATS